MFFKLLSLLICAVTSASFIACHSPRDSQRFFTDAAKKDPFLEPIHETPIYTVYYDHVIRRCVLHSSYTWGESGGGGGGTGIGVAVFPCDPEKLKAYLERLKYQVETGQDLEYKPISGSSKQSPHRERPQKTPTPVEKADSPNEPMVKPDKPDSTQPILN